MNELQLGLIGLGAVGVAGVFAYNKWQEHRHRKVAEQVLKRDHEDVLLARRGPPSVVPPDEDDLPAFDDAPVPPVAPVVEPRAVVEAPRVRIDQPDFRSVRERVEPGIHSEADLADERVEPMLATAVREDDERVPQLDEPVDEPAQQEPVPAPEPVSVPSVATKSPAPPPWADVPTESPRVVESVPAAEVPAILVSPAIDYIASFDLIEEVSGEQVLRSERDLLSRVTKPINWAGYNDSTREWVRVVEEGSYRRLRVGLQLADRRGALGEADLITFHGAMAALAEELTAVAEMPDHDGALNAAISLDQFCANVDIQIGLNLVSQGLVFPGTKIRALAEAAGMVMEPGGIFVRRDDDGYILYTLCNLESAGFTAEAMRNLSTHGLVFLLDIPCVSHGDRVFAQMLDVARRMADTLHGVLVDDNRRPLTEAALEPFRRQIYQYQSQLAAKGLPAGSPLALRLFS